MRIGVIEAGKVGGGLGKIWVRAGHQVLFSSRHPNKLKVLIEQAGPGAHAGTVSLPGSTTAGEELAKKLPNALVVKAFSTFPASFIPHAFYRPVELQRLVVFYCGDHRLSKAAVHHTNSWKALGGHSRRAARSGYESQLLLLAGVRARDAC